MNKNLSLCNERKLVLQADERSDGTHKDKLKPSFPCMCDRITAARMLNCPTKKLKMCIFLPVLFVHDLIKHLFFFSVEGSDVRGSGSPRRASVGLSFMLKKEDGSSSGLCASEQGSDVLL